MGGYLPSAQCYAAISYKSPENDKGAGTLNLDARLGEDEVSKARLKIDLGGEFPMKGSVTYQDGGKDVKERYEITRKNRYIGQCSCRTPPVESRTTGSRTPKTVGNKLVYPKDA